MQMRDFGRKSCVAMCLFPKNKRILKDAKIVVIFTSKAPRRNIRSKANTRRFILSQVILGFLCYHCQHFFTARILHNPLYCCGKLWRSKVPSREIWIDWSLMLEHQTHLVGEKFYWFCMSFNIRCTRLCIDNVHRIVLILNLLLRKSPMIFGNKTFRNESTTSRVEKSFVLSITSLNYLILELSMIIVSTKGNAKEILTSKPINLFWRVLFSNFIRCLQNRSIDLRQVIKTRKCYNFCIWCLLT